LISEYHEYKTYHGCHRLVENKRLVEACDTFATFDTFDTFIFV
jgi:hypothetical protein